MQAVVNEKRSNRVASILLTTLGTNNVMITDRFCRRFSFCDLFRCALLMMMSERVGGMIESKGSHLEKRPFWRGALVNHLSDQLPIFGRDNAEASSSSVCRAGGRRRYV